MVFSFYLLNFFDLVVNLPVNVGSKGRPRSEPGRRKARFVRHDKKA
jgi:hypothetical protein